MAPISWDHHRTSASAIESDAHIEPVAFIDDDKTKHRLEIMGLPVLGEKNRFKQLL
ncbi:nucleoside-diphosphate sugar epimerase/dehydratase [Bacillus sp. SL00103]